MHWCVSAKLVFDLYKSKTRDYDLKVYVENNL